MRPLNTFTTLSLFLLGGISASPTPPTKRWDFNPSRNPAYQLDIVDQLLVNTMPKVESWMSLKNATNGCTLEKAAIRREWSDLSVPEREEYIRAVLCLQSLPSKAPKDQVPGARSRFDDFVATHITQAFDLHSPRKLFAAHRYFIWAYEKALREECGYTGYQPYMNYERYADDPLNSPLFDGSPSSMSGNGLPEPYPGVPQGFPRPYNMIPPGDGGGCVTTGPFKDMVVNLGPRGGVLPNLPRNPRADGLGYNPRCLRRDVNKNSVAGARANYTYSLIMDHPDVDSFYNRYLGQPFLRGDPYPWGLHSAGHYLIGGDPGGDFYCSPGDPLFYFHHGMLDRVWWIWQMQDPENRVNAVPGEPDTWGPGDGSGHIHGKRQGSGSSSVWEDVIDLGWTAPPVKLMDLNDQLGGLGGELCYIYA